MQEQSPQYRIKKIYQMLFELATGNLNFRIEVTKPLDNVSELEEKLNQWANILQTKLENLEIIIPYYTYQSTTQHTFILNNKFQIVSFSSDVPEYFGIAKEELLNCNFEAIIAIQCKPIWEVIKEDINKESKYYNNLQILFEANNKIIPLHCSVFRLYPSDAIFISSITTIIEDILFTEKSSNLVITDKAIIQNLFQYIITHLEEPLPTTKELSIMFGTNEFKLKEIFRNQYNTSIYQFYNDERLKQANKMILETAIPLKEIAYLCGFNDYVTFSKAFKKKFNYTPSQLKRLD
ncbi:AraC family transcriptional regulator [Flavobacterium sp. SUN052]|uniref:helix-turn-helix domain-containing protein n=1 Tax=Flavobacterium sp. SUN052 TaxID=3002441 RepID=UPI00237DCA96|nr:AraC family transcriptional regulator [Flavobacterium sp. SUN052]MEC4004822.1 AraC family transcriptional regulator [Flavobacterium sp. SUN052]